MNVFELSTVASPAVGSVAAICAMPASGLFAKASGAVTGVIVGLVLNVVTRKTVCAIERVTHFEDGDKLTWRTLICPMIVLLPMITPLAAWGISAVLVKAMFS